MEKVSGMKRFKLLSGCRGVYVFTETEAEKEKEEEVERIKPVRGRGQRRQASREKGGERA